MIGLRARLRKWLGVVDPVDSEVDAPANGNELRRATSLMSQREKDSAVLLGKLLTPYPVKPYEAPPGVINPNRLAADGEIAASIGPGFLANDSEQLAPLWSWAQNGNLGAGFPGYAILSELAQRTEYRAAFETLAAEMTREWIEFKTEGNTAKQDDKKKTPDDNVPVSDVAPTKPPKPAEPPAESDEGDDESSETDDKIEQIKTAFEQFGIRDSFRRIAEQDGEFGRSQLFIDIKGHEEDAKRELPLLVDKATIKKGSVLGFHVIEPIWTTPYYYNAIDPTKSDFFKPRAWFIMGRRVHASRIFTFISREVPDILKPAYNFGGLSLIQLMEPYVFQWLRTRNSVSDLIHNFSIISLLTNLSALLQGEDGAANKLLDRVRTFVATRDNQGLMMLDKDSEELMQTAVPLSGLDALQAQSQEHMAGPTHIPLVKMFGVTPTGLNASSEGEIKVFYDHIRAMQQALFAKPLHVILQIVQLHLFGEIDDSITFEFVPMTSPSVKELAEIRKSDADAGVAYVNAGVISSDEERDRLIADTNSGYSMLSGEAPEPPAPEIDPETGLATGNELPGGFGKPPSGGGEPDNGRDI